MGEEKNGSITLYLYDASGSPVGMQYHGASYAADVWDTYYFEKNLQGDVVAVYDTNGTKLISYVYSAWGTMGSAYSNGGLNTTATKNPFRYRGYYYDSDLELYYLQTRYYDAKIGRFISPDTESVITATPNALTDKNLYAYCNNNPITYSDHTGEFPWHILIGAAVGAATEAVVSALSQWFTTGDVNWKTVAVSAGAGALSGALAASGFGPAAQMIGNTLISGAESFLSQGFEDGFNNVNYGTVISEAVISGIAARNDGISKGNAKHLMKQGVNTIKNFRGFGKTSKYYFSQTYKMFYKPFMKNSLKDGAKDTLSNVASFWAKEILRGA